jgi:hypothetical protein
VPTSELPDDRRHLTKSRFVAGLQCARRVWLQVHAPVAREAAAPGSLADLGIEVGMLARQLFPGGVAVDAEPWAHDEACRRTRALLADARVAAIFEAGFAAEGVRIRVDALERLPRGRWGLREVKMSGGVKDTHLDDLAIQLHVLRRCGLDIASVELVHVDTRYVRAASGLDPVALFVRAECRAEVEARLTAVGGSAADLLMVLRRDEPPEVEPSTHCFSPHACEYWERCTAGKPRDWVFHLPAARAPLRAAIAARCIERIVDIPDDVPLSAVQARLRTAMRRGGLVVEPGLAGALAALAPPVLCLDFETLAPPIPLYAHTRPYQAIPVQWSLHIDDGSGTLRHRAFLADGDGDPRRAFALTLLDALDRERGSIAVYSSYEAQQLRALARGLPDLAARLDAAVARLVDLLPILRAHVAHPDFRGSFSIKTVAPVLAPGITYADLDTVGDGEQASGALYVLAAGKVATPAERRCLRTALERYCARDTEALMALTHALRRLAAP